MICIQNIENHTQEIVKTYSSITKKVRSFFITNWVSNLEKFITILIERYILSQIGYYWNFDFNRQTCKYIHSASLREKGDGIIINDREEYLFSEIEWEYLQLYNRSIDILLKNMYKYKNLYYKFSIEQQIADMYINIIRKNIFPGQYSRVLISEIISEIILTQQETLTQEQSYQLYLFESNGKAENILLPGKFEFILDENHYLSK